MFLDMSRLLPGLNASAWEMIEWAAPRGYDTRVGFEDTLRLPDGTLAQNNAALVTAASSLVGQKFPSESA